MFTRHLPVSDPSPAPASKKSIDEDELLPRVPPTTLIATVSMDHPHGIATGPENSGTSPPPPNTSPEPDHNNHVTDTTTSPPPPYWSPSHSRSASYHSLNDVRPPAILLEDHSEETSQQTQSCWAQSVIIDEYVIVSGPSGIGAYVVWACTVTTLKGGDLSLRKRLVGTKRAIYRSPSAPKILRVLM